MLEDQFQDYGFDARSATTTLAGFMSVQNTYLSTFQSLGGLGLLLGTFGLAAVQLRSVLERKKELALMRAVGFGRGQLSWMILLENVWLLVTGLGIGLAAALFSTLPHWLIGSASVPWFDLAAIFVAIVLAGLASAWLASRAVSRMPLLESLRV
jgi:ABC-type antimicrobial peptide transport system permease subunit